MSTSNKPNPHQNRQIRSLQEYEQLKRKNRRRLVGTSVMVVLAGLLLAKALNQDTPDETAENITIAGKAASETAAPAPAIENTPAPSDDASDLSPSAVLEPVAEEDSGTGGKVLELTNPLQEKTSAAWAEGIFSPFFPKKDAKGDKK